jgi:hypothetical protein
MFVMAGRVAAGVLVSASERFAVAATKSRITGSTVSLLILANL